MTEMIYLSEKDLFNLIREGDISKEVTIKGRVTEIIIGTSKEEPDQSNASPIPIELMGLKEVRLIL